MPTELSDQLVLQNLKRRQEFLQVARTGRKHVAPGVIVQGHRRCSHGEVRIGLTCSRKIGPAVTRNRAKRRLRHAAAAVIAKHGRLGWDYVLVGRPEATINRRFSDLRADIETALAAIHERSDRRRTAGA